VRGIGRSDRLRRADGRFAIAQAVQKIHQLVLGGLHAEGLHQLDEKFVRAGGRTQDARQVHAATDAWFCTVRKNWLAWSSSMTVPPSSSNAWILPS